MAPSFGVISTQATCPSCNKTAPVSALMLFDYRTRVDREHPWIEHPFGGLVSHVTKINGSASRLWTAMSPGIRPTTFTRGGPFHYVNSCCHCNEPIGDVPLRAPGAVFNPASARDEARLSTLWLESTFLADGRVHVAEWMDRIIARQHPWA